MKLSRRSFLKLMGGAAATATLTGLNMNVTEARPQRIRVHYAKEVPTICPFCAVGCGIICHVRDGQVVNTEGDADHPVNEGTLCSKGAALFNMAFVYTDRGEIKPNPQRMQHVLYRAPGAKDWEVRDWDWALDTIAQRIHDTREATFETTDEDGVTVNRTTGIAHLGSACVTNEENYLLHKMMRGFGLINIDHCARLCHSSTVPALMNSFGRGAMTNHWIDYQHSDVLMNLGGNTAENHPVSMKWIEKARERGAKLIVVDPRFTRTAAVADLYAPIRPGTNNAFFAGLINYALENQLYHGEYVRHYTNATYLVDPEFGFDEGLFSGAETLDDGQVTYDTDSWAYQVDDEGNVRKDESLLDPNCVYQLMKAHFSRYDVATVSAITGCPEDKFREVADLFCSTGKAGLAGNVMYAMGMTQFTSAAQGIRACAILQLLLGNMGIPGGGVNAQRGESNVQGSTDMAMLYHIIPGYMPVPTASKHPTMDAYLEAEVPPSGFLVNRPKHLVSLMKAYWGDAATPENDFAFDYHPKMDDQDRSEIGIFDEMAKGNIKGLVSWAQNPAVGGSAAKQKRQAARNLDWLVSVDLFANETATFWKEPGVNPEEIDTEVFLLPAALDFERDGSIANSGRWLQWRYEAMKPPGDAKPDLWIADRLFRAVREKYREEPGVFADPILEMVWDYGEDARSDRVAMELNGYNTRTGALLQDFRSLEDDGDTACGNWLYSGYYNDEADPPTKRRTREKNGIGLHPDWSYAWPLNRRILYNRCSADPNGRPWSDEKRLLWVENGRWTGYDVPDFNTTVPARESANTPFIMLAEQQALLFSAGMVDGPFPEHYEPWESPVQNVMSDRHFNPVSTIWYPNLYAGIASDEYPYIATSYRVSEHYQTGMMTRNMPWLNEIMPGVFVEISPSLARKIGVENGDMVIISSPRGEYEAAACVTPRVKPFRVHGEEYEMVGMLWHWGYAGMSSGGIANDVTPSIGDANTTIPEYKAFLCNIRKRG